MPVNDIKAEKFSLIKKSESTVIIEEYEFFEELFPFKNIIPRKEESSSRRPNLMEVLLFFEKIFN